MCTFKIKLKEFLVIREHIYLSLRNMCLPTSVILIYDVISIVEWYDFLTVNWRKYTLNIYSYPVPPLAFIHIHIESISMSQVTRIVVSETRNHSHHKPKMVDESLMLSIQRASLVRHATLTKHRSRSTLFRLYTFLTVPCGSYIFVTGV